MKLHVQYLVNHKGEKIGIYLPLIEWEKFQKEYELLKQQIVKKHKISNSRKIKFPTYNLGDDITFDRNEIYEESLKNRDLLI